MTQHGRPAARAADQRAADGAGVGGTRSGRSLSGQCFRDVLDEARVSSRRRITPSRSAQGQICSSLTRSVRIAAAATTRLPPAGELGRR